MILLSIGVVLPAYAQSGPGATAPSRSEAGARPMARPVLLQPANVAITEAEKQTVRLAAVKAFAASKPGIHAALRSDSAPSQWMVTGTQTVAPATGNPTLVMTASMVDYDPRGGHFLLSPGASSHLTFVVNAEAKTVYTLVVTANSDIFAYGGAKTIFYTVTAGGQLLQGSAADPVPTAAELAGPANQFVYAFVADQQLPYTVTVSSSNGGWEFVSCELTAASME
jgi:hypothetical protein